MLYRCSDAGQEGLVRAISWCKPELAEPLVGAVLPYSLSVSFRLIMPGHSAKMVSLKDVTSALTQHSINWEDKQRENNTVDTHEICVEHQNTI